MRNQQVGRASRVALFAVLLVSLSMWACQDPQREAPKDAVSDFALGVDGDFGVETFALGAPSISFLLPTTSAPYYLGAGGINTIPGTPCLGAPGAYACANTGTDCLNNLTNGADQTLCSPFVQMSVSNFPLGVGQGEIHCRVNGGATVYSSNPSAVPEAFVPGHTDMVQISSIGYTQGLYTIECVLADASGVELTNPEARTKRSVQLISDPFDPTSTKCKNDAECDDANNCSAEICIAGKCVYTAMANCCTDDWFCAPGESCLNPNTQNSKCSSCALDGDCDDAVSCTVDKCDMTGIKGKCTHIVPPETCCTGFTKCDDGKPCTIDSCKLQTGCGGGSPGAVPDLVITGSSQSTFVTGASYWAQGFTSNSLTGGNLSKVTFPILNTNSGAQVEVSIWHGTPDTPGATQVGTTGTATLPSTTGAMATATVYGFGAATLIAGESYYVAIHSLDPTVQLFTEENVYPAATLNSAPAAGGPYSLYLDATGTAANLYVTTYLGPPALPDCDIDNNTCKHDQPAGACCADEECVSPDPCKVGGCIALQCRFAINGDKKDCCSATTNPGCDDKNICTIDACGAIQPGGWEQCTHESNGVPGCCQVNEDCVDSNGCTQDLCIGFQCQHLDMPDCCKTVADCNDQNICTVDTCPIQPGLDAAQCVHAKTAECCNTTIDCNDQKFCTTDTCNTVEHTCSHNQTNAACCDQDSQCSDGKLCTADLCINHGCLFIKDGNKPNCCEDANIGTCDDKNACTIDSCKIQTGCGGSGTTTATPDVTYDPTLAPGGAFDYDNLANSWQGQTFTATQTGTLKSITVKVAQTACGTATCTNTYDLYVYSAIPTAAGVATQLGGKVTTTAALTPDGAYYPLVFDVAAAGTVNVVAGWQYFFVLTATGTVLGNPNVRGTAFATTPYAGGAWARLSGTSPIGTYTYDPGYDLVFSTVVNVGGGGAPTVTATPDVTRTTVPTNGGHNLVDWWVGQTFTATQTGALKSISAMVYTMADMLPCAGPGGACVNIYELFVYDKVPTGPGIAVQLGGKLTATLSTPGDHSKQLLTFDVAGAGAVPLTAGSSYFFVLRSTTNDGNPVVAMDSGAYAGGYYANYPTSAASPIGPYQDVGADDLAFDTVVNVTSGGQPPCDANNNTCQHVPNGVTGCCNTPSDCDDTDCHTLDLCGSNNMCIHKPNPYACAGDLDCDDGNGCTIDACDSSTGCGVCTHAPAAGCCTTDVQCDDKQVCTVDKCVNFQCTTSPKADCCNTDADALTICDDKNSCTIDYCQSNQCHHTAPKNGCCKTNSDCFDGNKCTADVCDTALPVGDHFTCSYAVQDPNCVDCSADSAIAGIDCQDNNICTADYCDAAGHCHNNPVAECCMDKFDCDDHNDCTADYCTGQHTCFHGDTISGILICCKPASQDVDCAYLNTECQKGVCLDAGKGNGSTVCQALEQDVCTVNIGYCQPFESATTLHGMGWNPMVGDIATFKNPITDPSNWTVENTGVLGTDHYANFSWTPTKTNYGACLQSPIIQAAGASTITLQYDHSFQGSYSGSGASSLITVLGSTDGANADWENATVIDSVVSINDFGPETLDVKLPTGSNGLTGSNNLRLAFCVQGASTIDLTNFSIDNVCVVKGNKPAMVACPVNLSVPYQSTKTWPLKAKDPDYGDLLYFQMIEGPSFITLSSATYYWLDKSWNTTMTIKPTTPADVGTHTVKIKVSDGALYSICSFEVTVTYNGGYLVVRPSTSDSAAAPADFGEALAAALRQAAPGKIVQHVEGMDLYPSFAPFEAVFVVLGVFPDRHQLNADEAAKFQTYLNGGGHLYMEGGDTWFYDDQFPLHASFKVNPLADVVPDDIAPELLGQSIYKDLTLFPPKLFSFGFSFSDIYNNQIDSISAKEEVHRTQNLLKSNGPFDRPWVQVGHDDDSGFRTVASAIPFAGVMPGPVSGDQPVAMVTRILEFFNNGFIDCIGDGDCDDQDDCTVDTCTKNECFYQNKCTCTNNQLLACGDTITVTTGGPGSSSAVKSYGCDTGTFLGKEMGYTFSTTTSRPATLTVTNNNANPSTRVFVTRTVAEVCAPAQCMAEVGSGSKNFAAAANEVYYIMVDTPTLQNPGTLTLQVTCGDPEICNDGIDNNNNTLIDCQDLGACCGDAACGEICDGLDNNCDGATDEGCDKDGDGWCDATATIVGNPLICSAGVGDCNDLLGVIHPGQPDICGNNKDDNCNNLVDEGGTLNDGSGCTNYWVDADNDTYGNKGAPQCLCVPTANYSVTRGGDCDDSNKKVNPFMIEVCNNNLDDNCDGSQNDQNAQGSTEFYLDHDGDGTGANMIGNTGKQWLCVAAGEYTADAPGDCNDSNQFVHPGAQEVCNNVDDDCNGLLDEGCDSDTDGYCDATMGYVSIGATSQKCAQSADGGSIDLVCDPGEYITAIDFASFGNPSGVCGTYKAGTCAGGQLTTAAMNACIGWENCHINVGIGTLGDGCPGVNPKYFDVQVTCMGSGGTAPGICPWGPGDTDDTDPLINPNGKEICDNIDNNSDGFVDEGCDDDNDNYCDKFMTVLGAPFTCTAGGNDCNDDDVAINPFAKEDCSTEFIDENCNTILNDQDAENCTVFFFDGDSDGYGTKSFKCFCEAVSSFKAKKTADCVDTDPTINPGIDEICNGIDDDCDGVVDNGCDKDGDGFCATGKFIAPGNTVCSNGGGDCNDDVFEVNPSAPEVCFDGIDNNCNGSQNDVGALLGSLHYSDVDNDGYGGPSAKKLCAPSGNFKVLVPGDCNDNDAAINPAATEICDDIDNNCAAISGVAVDENCDKDGDKYCDGSKTMVGTPKICPLGGMDCNDYPDPCTTSPYNAPNCGGGDIHPNLLKEVCDNIDDDCDGIVDNGCDKDGDHYCDADFAVVGLPLICQFGVNDCDDLDKTVNPGAPEVCGNDKDDNCNGNQNDIGAKNCQKFYQDDDGDGFGLDAFLCLCVADGGYVGKVGGDCDDANADVHPNQPEDCHTPYDDNCNLNANDEGALNCTTYALDGDGDGHGLINATACYCEMTAPYTATLLAAADCNDANDQVFPGQTEQCNDIDDNCVAGVDEGCNLDGDAFCTSGMTTNGFPNICAAGGGDCNDGGSCSPSDAACWAVAMGQNPGAPEICDGINNNCAIGFQNGVNGSTIAIDEGCDKDGDAFCDADKLTVKLANGNWPTACPNGGGDCNDTVKLIHPGPPSDENCLTTWDDNCSPDGDANDIGATGCKEFGVDVDGDTYSDKTLSTTCYCHATGINTGTKDGDCDDLNNLMHPDAAELCDNFDNDCNGTIDEGCDKDGDHYCDSGKITVGLPDACTRGGGDCNDFPIACPNNWPNCGGVLINPGVKEDCNTPGDDNCNTITNEADALGCIPFYLDYDGDHYGVNVSQCLCAASGNYNIDIRSIASGGAGGLLGDCDDTTTNVNPGMTEVCGDGVDNNCNGSQNDPGVPTGTLFYLDADKDGYGPASGGSQKQCFAEGLYVASISGDCNDGISCAVGDSACIVTNASANAIAATQNPGQVEKCDGLDNNCATGAQFGVNGGSLVAADEGCDQDNDTYCDANKVTVGTPGACSAGGGDCVDTDNTIHPNQPEVCDTIDQNCNKIKDEGCDDDKDGYCDPLMTVTAAGIAVPNGVCQFTTITVALKGDDCDDTNKLVNPGKVEICDGIDNDCKSGPKFGSLGGVSVAVDEGCDKDNDTYCDSGRQTAGQPGNWPAACSHGGGDCDDLNKLVNPGVAEICDGIDNNCAGPNGGVDETCVDFDLDGYCVGFVAVNTGKCYRGGGDCNDNDTNVNPGAAENCLTQYDDNCDTDANPTFTGSANVTGATKFFQDVDGDGWGTVNGQFSCYQTGQFTSLFNTDCNDGDKLVNPGALEICDGKDNNCASGVLHSFDNSITASDEGCDTDNDGYCTASMLIAANAGCDNKPSGLIPVTRPTGTNLVPGSDCVDLGSSSTNPPIAGISINKGTGETCNNADDNCDGVIDEGCDDDKDGYCDQNMTVSIINTAVGACGNDTHAVIGAGTDCDDTKFYVKPGVKENCTTPDNDNCSLVDTNPDGCTTFFVNGDGDNYGQSANTQCLCPAAGNTAPAGFAAVGGDCDDSKGTVYPGATETCDGIDNNCNASSSLFTDTLINATTFKNSLYNYDAQSVVITQTGVLTSVDVWVMTTTPSINMTVDMYVYVGGLPGAGGTPLGPTAVGTPMSSVANVNSSSSSVSVKVTIPAPSGVNLVAGTTYYFIFHENTLAGQFIEDDKTNTAYASGQAWYAGSLTGAYAGLGSTGIETDLHMGVNLSTTGPTIDEGCDVDGDKYCKTGLALTTAGKLATCPKSALPSSPGVGDDCDDTDPTINPGAVEICDGVNNNCATGAKFGANGGALVAVDEGCDQDQDGYCDAGKGVVGFATDVITLVKNCPNGGGDCADLNSAIHPGTQEACNQKDDNCNGIVDDIMSNINPSLVGKLYYADGDGDGDPIASSQQYCQATGIYTYLLSDHVGAVAPSLTYGSQDCDDNPAACGSNCSRNLPENRCDGYDNNCKAGGPIVDEGCDDDGDDWCDSSFTTLKNNTTSAGCSAVSPCWPVVCPNGLNDCNDINPAGFGIHPTAPEVCDGIDNDCSGTNNDGAASSTCNAYFVALHATGTCSGTACAQNPNSCASGYVDTSPAADGCECWAQDPVADPQETQTNGNEFWNTACNVGTLTDTSKLSVSKKGIVATNTDNDWFTFNGADGSFDAVDPAGNSSGGYGVRVRFTVGPGNIIFDVYRGPAGGSLTAILAATSTNVNDVAFSNPATNNNSGNTSGQGTPGSLPETWGSDTSAGGGGVRPNVTPGMNQVCCGNTDFNWFTNFTGFTTANPSHLSEFGEAACQPVSAAAFDSISSGWNVRASPATLNGPYARNWTNVATPVPTGWDVTQCLDDSAQYWVRVYRTDGTPSCQAYTIEFSNGVWSPSTGNGRGGW